MSKLVDDFLKEQKELHFHQQDVLPIWQHDYFQCPICTFKWVCVHPKDMEEAECPSCHNSIEPINLDNESTNL